MNMREFNGSTFARSCNDMPKDTMEFSHASTSHSCSDSSNQADASYFKPDHITLNHQSGSLAVDWNTAPNGYQIVLYHEHQDINSQIVVNPPARFNMAGLPAGKYCARVYVNTGNDDEQECDVCTPIIFKLDTPSDIALFYDQIAQKVKVNWKEVPGATQYQVQLMAVLNSDESLTTDQQFEIDAAVLTKPTHSYRAWVQAKGDAQHIDSEVGQSVATLSLLPAPVTVTQSYDVETQQLTASWESVPAATGYLVQVVNLDANQQVVDQQQVDRSQTSYAFDSSQWLEGSAEAHYQIRVKSLGDTQHLDSAFRQATPPIKRLATPAQVTIAATQLALSANWQSVPGAARYYAQVINVDRNNAVVTTQLIAPQPDQPLIASFDFDQFLKGHPPANYQIWVSAMGETTDTQTLASSFGKPSNTISLVDTTNPTQPDSATVQVAAKKLIDATESSAAAMQTALNDSNTALQAAIAALNVASDRDAAQAAVDAVNQVSQSIQVAQTDVEAVNQAAQALPQPLTLAAAAAVATAAKIALSKAAGSTFDMAAASRANFDAEKTATNSPGANTATQSRVAITQALNSLQSAVQTVKAASDAAEALVQVLIAKQSV